MRARNHIDRAGAAQVRRCGQGFAAEGPGYYVWDTDRRTVAITVLEMQAPRPRRVRRTVSRVTPQADGRER
jgi:hypothetical protein